MIPTGPFWMICYHGHQIYRTESERTDNQGCREAALNFSRYSLLSVYVLFQIVAHHFPKSCFCGGSFFLAIKQTSKLVSLSYISLKVYTNFGTLPKIYHRRPIYRENFTQPALVAFQDQFVLFLSMVLKRKLNSKAFGYCYHFSEIFPKLNLICFRSPTNSNRTFNVLYWYTHSFKYITW